MRLVLWVFVGAVLFVAVAAAFSAWHVFVKERDAKRALDVARSDYADLEARKASLEEKVKALGTERGVEEVIRERFPVAKPGEEVITIVNPEGKNLPATTTPRRNFWETVSSWFSW